MDLNARSLRLAESLLDRAEERKVAAHPIEKGGRYVDCGIDGPRRPAGRARAGAGSAWPTWPTSRSCRARSAGGPCPLVQVVTDHPVEACLASQYAGWAIQEGKFFAMGSGPMRAAAGKEPVFDKIGGREEPEAVVGVLEDAEGADAGGRRPDRRRPAGSRRRRSRCWSRRRPAWRGACRSSRGRSRRPCTSSSSSVSTSAASSRPTAPPPCRRSPRDDLAAIGRTNDAILYGARVVLFVTRRRRVDRGDRPEGPLVRLEGPRRAVRRDLRALQPRLLRGRPPPVQPGRGRLPEHRDGPRLAFGAVAPDVLVRSFFGA